MSQKRIARIRTVADYGSGTAGHDHSYGFVFSSEIEDWQQSKRFRANKNMRERYHESKKA